MRARFSVLLGVMVVVLGACAGDDANTTTTAADVTTTVTGLPEIDETWECFYLNNYVALVPNQGESTDSVEARAIDVLDDLGPIPTAAGSAEILDDEDVPENLTGPGSITERIDEVLGLVRTSLDPLQAAEYLRTSDSPVAASPIHAMAPAVHWTFKPGTDPTPIGGSLPEVPSATAGYVAVVDTGFVPGGPGWLSGDNVLYDPFDIELNPDPASHGTFISGLIRQISPTFGVSIARAPNRPPDDYQTRNHQAPSVNLVSEMHAFEAVLRLIIRNETSPQNIGALNMSLGTYSCNPSDDALLATLTVALNTWNTEIGAPVFAAGGNELAVQPFWPGALPEVSAVGAADQVGQQIVWVTGVSGVPGEEPYSSRKWIDAVAPGSNLVSVAGEGSTVESELVAWSGSSFASAVAAALYVAQIAPVDVDGLSWWPNAGAEYGRAPGLSYTNNPSSGQFVTAPPASTGTTSPSTTTAP